MLEYIIYDSEYIIYSESYILNGYQIQGGEIVKLYAMSMKPLKVQAMEIIRDAIIDGVLKDGDMITEKVAKERFGISRTPFREAVQILEANNWLYTIPYTGTYVKPITMEDIDEVFEMRMIVEPAIVKHLQNQKVSFEKLYALTHHMEEHIGEMSDIEFMSEDREYHAELYRLTNNKRLISTYDEISEMMLRIGIHVLFKQDRRLEVVEEHWAIIRALEQGNGEELLVSHLKKTKQSFIEVYQSI